MIHQDTSAAPDYTGMLSLSGKGFIVLGGGFGMGRQSCHALSQAGAKVVCVDNVAERASTVAAEVGGIAWTGDVTRRDQVASLVAFALQQLGRIDGVVDIVGQAAWAGFGDIDDALWDQQFALNLRHAYLISQLVAPHMQAQGGGVMTFIASVSGMTGAPHHSAYGAAKAAMMSLVRSLAVELGPAGIRVNAVAPGSIMTPRVMAMLDAEGRQKNKNNPPLKKDGLPANIASAVLFLSSELSAFVTGQTLVVDGGVSVKFPYPV
jgi:NAD(P)-dependent dehydrogenase (short-subunit alcohol dehydrogenase family)